MQILPRVNQINNPRLTKIIAYDIKMDAVTRKYKASLLLEVGECSLQDLIVIRRHINKGWSKDELALVLNQCLKGLIVLHGASIVHRDIKPAIIAITKEGNLKIINFGVSEIYKRDNDGKYVVPPGIGTRRFWPKRLVGKKI